MVNDDDGTRPPTVLVMSEETRDQLFTPPLVRRLCAAAAVDLDRVVDDLDRPSARTALAEAEILLTGWGVPAIDASALDLMPRLRAIVHAGGTVKTFLDAEVFARDIHVSTAADANAVPVAEFTLAAIVFAAKRAGVFAHRYHALPTKRRDELGVTGVGANGIVVGVIGASRIGRRVIDLLAHLDVHVLLADPYVEPVDAAALGVELVDVDALVRRADVVTLHAPEGPSTRRLIDRRRLGLMRDGATLVNTARGSLVDTDALVPEVVSGRLQAVLDVTLPEPLPAGSPLFGLPNVLLTPHIAGAMGNEVPRLAEVAVSEIERLAAGLPLLHPVRGEDLTRIA